MKREGWTDRQEAILRLAGDGLADKEIARELSIALGTLRTYWQRMREKSGARSRGELIASTLRLQFDSLRKQHELQAVLLRTLPFGIWTVTSSGKIEFYNDWFLEYGGLRASEVEKNGCRALMLYEDFPASSARWARANATGEGYSAAVRLVCAHDQTLRWHEIRLCPIEIKAGKVERWCGTAHEIASVTRAPTSIRCSLPMEIDRFGSRFLNSLEQDTIASSE